MDLYHPIEFHIICWFETTPFSAKNDNKNWLFGPLSPPLNDCIISKIDRIFTLTTLHHPTKYHKNYFGNTRENIAYTTLGG
jgi:hypothetical protein